MFNVKSFQFFRTWGRLYFVTLFFVTLAAALFWLDFFRAYRAEMQILVIGKTQATSTDQVVENFAELTHNLSFYEKVIAGNDLLDDDFAGLSKDKRKARWNAMLSVERGENSGMLTLSLTHERSEIAKLFAEETAKELFETAGFYYNVKTDLDMRVVDGPIVKTVISDPWLYAVATGATGIAVTTLFFWLLQVAPTFFGGTKKGVNMGGEKAYPDFHIGESVPLIDPKKFVPSRPASLSFEAPTAEEKQEEKQIREEILSTHHSAAPANLPVAAPDDRNLPVAMEDLPFQFEEVTAEEVPEETEQEEKESEKESASEESVSHPSEKTPEKLPEPTVEEYKRRLNELLRGSK